ncbi:MAG: DUF5320 domain-containing protein [Candidatus Nanoarchaeia archaeon]|nr:DUF5320 domain-containing protein [Candidatus Nanoarchaeia archaeon]
MPQRDGTGPWWNRKSRSGWQLGNCYSKLNKPAKRSLAVALFSIIGFVFHETVKPNGFLRPLFFKLLRKNKESNPNKLTNIIDADYKEIKGDKNL